MRKKFLVKPLLQLRHLSWTLAIIFLGLIACYFVIESIISAAVMSGPLGPDQWTMLRGQLRLSFGLSGLILLIAIGFENYLFFHTIIGPIYALEKGLKRLIQGDYYDETRIRQSDELSEVIMAFEEMKKQIASKIEMQEKAAVMLAAELDRILANTSPENIKVLKTKLKEIRDQVEKKAA